MGPLVTMTRLPSPSHRGEFAKTHALLVEVCGSSLGDAFDVARRGHDYDWQLAQIARTCFAPIDDEANRLVLLNFCDAVLLFRFFNWFGALNYWQVAHLTLP
jgi:hypothetical protein